MEIGKIVKSIISTLGCVDFLNCNPSVSKPHFHLLTFFFLGFMLVSVSLVFSNWFPEVSLKPSGSAYFGKYTGNSERYNLEGGIDILLSTLSWKTSDFFVEYISNLEMARQVGNVSLDPRYSHTFIIGGFRFKKGSYLIKSYLVHDCKHVIDQPPDSNKVVFNRLKFSLSHNLSSFRNRFQIRTTKKDRLRKLRWEFIYGFYPKSKVIDYLNSRPYYHHDFELTLEYPLFFFANGEILSAFNGRFIISANDPPKYYRDVSLLLEAVFFNERGALSFYIENFPVSEDPIKSPEGLSILGVRYLF